VQCVPPALAWNRNALSALSSPPLAVNSGLSLSHPSKTGELMMPPADRILEQNGQDPGRVAHTRQDPGPLTF